MKKRRHLPPFEVEIERLGARGVGVGTAPDGRPVEIRGAPPGYRLQVVPTGLSKGTWTARRLATIRPSADAATPPCPVFGLCGGCSLQEISPAAQRRLRAELAVQEVLPFSLRAGEPALRAPHDGIRGVAPGRQKRSAREAGRTAPVSDALDPGTGAVVPGLATSEDVVVHPIRGADLPFGYRNRVELSFGVRRYLSEADHAAGAPIGGRYLGFHAPGRFDRVVDVERCWLVSERANEVIATVRRLALDPDGPAPYDPRTHEGYWRHLLVRESFAEGKLLVALYTTSSEDVSAVDGVCAAVAALPDVAGVVHVENDGVADVARGTVRRTWGADAITERLGDVALRVGLGTFLQTSTAGAVVLYDAVADALGDAGGTLLDLYCGVGSIGLYLSKRFDRVIGIEEVADSVADAVRNAEVNGVDATFVAAKVEDALDVVKGAGRVAAVVDPPRAGLHPKVAEALGGLDADVLVYVACNPASLGRDAPILAAGGWRMTDLWPVDLFPQTGHVEVVARFVR